jgi:hypothetical protein
LTVHLYLVGQKKEAFLLEAKSASIYTYTNPNRGTNAFRIGHMP